MDHFSILCVRLSPSQGTGKRTGRFLLQWVARMYISRKVEKYQICLHIIGRHCAALILIGNASMFEKALPICDLYFVMAGFLMKDGYVKVLSRNGASGLASDKVGGDMYSHDVALYFDDYDVGYWELPDGPNDFDVDVFASHRRYFETICQICGLHERCSSIKCEVDVHPCVAESE